MQGMVHRRRGFFDTGFSDCFLLFKNFPAVAVAEGIFFTGHVSARI